MPQDKTNNTKLDYYPFLVNQHYTLLFLPAHLFVIKENGMLIVLSRIRWVVFVWANKK